MSKENSVRKSSLIYHYGIGGLWTNNSDETFVVKAPKHWKWSNGRGLVLEENLRKHLGVDRIIFPPGAKDKQIDLKEGSVAIGRFPGWHRCKGWRTLENGKREQCGAMLHLDQYDKLPLCNEQGCSGRPTPDQKVKNSTFAPVRFMVICADGHLDDFPFHQWVHNEDLGTDHKLRYTTTSGSGLAGINIICETCSSPTQNVQRTMRGALSPDSFSSKDIKCSGRSPWLHDIETLCECTSFTGVQKASSNLLFPILRNSIFCPLENSSLPEWVKTWVDEKIAPQFDHLMSSFKGMVPDPMEKIIEIFGNHFTPEEKDLIFSKRKEIEKYLGPALAQDPFFANGYQGIYQREYDRFLHFSEDQKLDDFTIQRPEIHLYEQSFTQKVEMVGLLEKLRDTRVYVGFSRIAPENEISKDTIKNCYGSNEVVGDIVRGEGIFLKFSQKEISSWTERKEVEKRFKILTTLKQEELLANKLVGSFEDALSYMLIHSISHSLISEIAIFSGYNTASIRERIYIGSDGKGGKMFGLLIYTSDGDSEGSLGGLVRLGKPGVLEKIFEQAIVRATWCSSDPLCSYSIPKGAQGSNLAACHHCLLLPETSCEARNEFLDRELIISNNNPHLGFYIR